MDIEVQESVRVRVREVQTLFFMIKFSILHFIRQIISFSFYVSFWSLQISFFGDIVLKIERGSV